MKLVVADSSPLIVFARSEMLVILRKVVGEIVVPQTVYSECTGDMGKPGAKMIAAAHQARLITLHADSKIVTPPANLPMLDKGEIAAIALALELGEPVLMDERLGRQAAVTQGVPVIGSAGILLTAKNKKLISEVRPILESWQEFGYFLSPALITIVLQRAGEK
jgi:predicted nucleic acid-binding protein